MRQLGRLVRFIFGCEALSIFFAIPSVILSARRMQAEGELEPKVVAVFAFVLVVGLVLSIVTGIAWWSLRKGWSSARGWGIAASLINLLLFPIGTIVTIAGLMAFWRRSVVAEIAISPKKRLTPIPGDGTNKYSGSVLSVLQVALLMVAADLWYRWAERHGLASQVRWISILQIEAAIWVNVLCHELGHVFAGWATEMKLRAFVIGPLRFTLRSGKWGCEFNPAGLWGGGAAGLAPTHLRDMRSRQAFMIAAGPVASLITAILATAVALTAPGHAWAPAWKFLSWLATFAWVSAIINCIPVRPQDQYSDGAQIYQLLSNGPWADFHMAFSMVASSAVTPLRARDFDVAVLNRAAAFMVTGKRGMLLNLFLYVHHCDCGRTEEGLRYFEIAESMYPQIASDLPADLHLEFVYANAYLKQDLAAAQLWWQRMEAKGKTSKKVDYWKARTSLLWLEGNIGEAREAWRKADSWARQMPAAGAYDRERDELAVLGAALDASETAQSQPVAVLS
jgi:sterol desaturase/sphingolipid hydroxylase (fatty acid hydroxylase superfamily)